jgi:transcriptional regulator with XRE-family HTH domain
MPSTCQADQFAQALDISQQMVASYEVGRRTPVSMLQLLAQALSVSIDELLGEPAKTRSKRGPASVLARHMERISAPPQDPAEVRYPGHRDRPR